MPENPIKTWTWIEALQKKKKKIQMTDNQKSVQPHK